MLGHAMETYIFPWRGVDTGAYTAYPKVVEVSSQLAHTACFLARIFRWLDTFPSLESLPVSDIRRNFGESP